MGLFTNDYVALIPRTPETVIYKRQYGKSAAGFHDCGLSVCQCVLKPCCLRSTRGIRVVGRVHGGSAEIEVSAATAGSGSRGHALLRAASGSQDFIF